jgi:hypothetical protein
MNDPIHRQKPFKSNLDIASSNAAERIRPQFTCPDAGGRGLNTNYAKRLVRRFTKSWTNGPQVVLVESAEALHEAAGATVGSVSTRAEGARKGKPAVFINITAIDNLRRFREVLAHESLGFFGVEQVVGDALLDIAKKVAKHIEKGTGAPWMRRAISQVQARQPAVTDRVKLAREVIAVMAEQGSRNTLVGKVTARTRHALRQAIPSVTWTNRDVRDLLSKVDG